MKKIILSITCSLFLSAVSFGQEERIVSSLEPTKASRFLKWTAEDALGYRVRVFKKEANGSLTEVLTTETTKNFIQLEKEHLKKDHFYRIEGKSTGTLSVVEGGDVNAIGPNGPNYNETICLAKCNGPSYSWTLQATEEKISTGAYDDQGELIIESTGNAFVTLLDGAGYYDGDGNYQPFYMMMDQVDLNWYKIAHEASGGNPLVQKCANIGSNCYDNFDYQYVTGMTPSSGYRDMNGNTFTGASGFLVKKSSFRYNWMTGNRTSDLPLASVQNLCGSPASNLWCTAFNASMNYAGNSVYNSSNAGIWTQTLGCIDTPYGAGTGSTGNGGNPGGHGDWSEYMHNAVLDCIGQNESAPLNYYDCLPALTNGGNGNGNSGVDNVHSDEFELIQVIYTSDKSRTPGVIGEEIVWTPSKNSEFYKPNNVILEDGLYLAQFIFPGRVIPIYFENIKANNKIDKISDFVTLNVSPNPIQNNTLNIDVLSSKKIKYDLKIYNLDGEVFHAENGTLNADVSKNINKKITKKANPYNQLKVVFTFEDGSTTEKTVSTL